MGNWRVEISGVSEFEIGKFQFDDGKLYVEPLFHGNGLSANLAVMRVFNGEDKLLSTSLLAVSGSNGKPLLKVLSEPVKPAMEREKKAKPAKAPTATKP